ncbi:MAG: hypothetical protein ACXWT0_01635 [Methylobacter sp.]
MTKILNIDGLGKKEDRAITLKGVSYPLKEMSVGDYIKINEMAEEVDKKGDISPVDTVKFLVESIAISFPTCPKEILMELTSAELSIISTFARDGSMPEDAVTSEVVTDAQEGGEKK